ncbi:MAG: hypothetical protein QNK99_02835, partial [Burkholderiales bacterium]
RSLNPSFRAPSAKAIVIALVLNHSPNTEYEREEGDVREHQVSFYLTSQSSFFVSLKLLIDNVTLCRPSPRGVWGWNKGYKLVTQTCYTSQNHDFVTY